MYNQCIFYNIKNFWLKLTHCENKSWKKLCPSFLNCKLSTILQHFFHKILGRIFFSQLVGAGIFFIQNRLEGIFFQNHPPPHQKLNGRPLSSLYSLSRRRSEYRLVITEPEATNCFSINFQVFTSNNRHNFIKIHFKIITI